MMKKNNNDSGVLLLMLGLLVIMAACPPIGVVLVLCIVFSDGTVSGFVGCLTPFIILVLVALISMAFS